MKFASAILIAVLLFEIQDGIEKKKQKATAELHERVNSAALTTCIEDVDNKFDNIAFARSNENLFAKQIAVHECELIWKGR